jgi:hypothetical protein
MNERVASSLQADAFSDVGESSGTSGALHAIADWMCRLVPNQTLEIRATDPSFTVDLTAWCRLTGHVLVIHAGNCYLIRHK